jgi:LexA-binding, inner membrane-associated putative hydrolase
VVACCDDLLSKKSTATADFSGREFAVAPVCSKRQHAAPGATYLEPLTHFLTGACIGRAGFNRKTAYATLAAVLAAEAADIDILWGLAGPVQELKHHRGITHTFIGVPVIAGVVVGAVWLWHRWRSSNGRRQVGHGGCLGCTGDGFI